jgi:hypothetical protein
MEALDGRLAELSTKLSAHPEIARELDRLRNWVDAARMRLAGEGGTAGSSGAATEGGASEPTNTGTAPGAAPGATSSPPDSSAAGGGTDAPEAAAANSTESGAGQGRWWTHEYDAVVERWLESRRLDLEERARAGAAPPEERER